MLIFGASVTFDLSMPTLKATTKFELTDVYTRTTSLTGRTLDIANINETAKLEAH